jgi:hypothetical protein
LKKNNEDSTHSAVEPQINPQTNLVIDPATNEE